MASVFAWMSKIIVEADVVASVNLFNRYIYTIYMHINTFMN